MKVVLYTLQGGVDNGSTEEESIKGSQRQETLQHMEIGSPRHD